jgi:hypothetical protein
MKRSFKTFLTESEEQTPVSFYNLYYTQFPSEKVQKMKDGKEKEKELEIEEIKYKNLLTDFLRKCSSMN